MEVLLVLPLIMLVSLMLAMAPALAMGTYTGSDNGKAITVKSGETFTVKLDENPTTGYSWNMTVGDGLKIINDRYVANKTGLVGSGGYHIWTIQATKPGTYKVAGVYKRPWEPLTGGEQKYSLSVSITAAGSGSAAPINMKFDVPSMAGLMPKFSHNFSSLLSHFPKLIG